MRGAGFKRTAFSQCRGTITFQFHGGDSFTLPLCDEGTFALLCRILADHAVVPEEQIERELRLLFLNVSGGGIAKPSP
jgi:hypothetical protein